MLLHWFQRPPDNLLLLATSAAHGVDVALILLVRCFACSRLALDLASPAFRRSTHTHKDLIYVLWPQIHSSGFRSHTGKGSAPEWL